MTPLTDKWQFMQCLKAQTIPLLHFAPYYQMRDLFDKHTLVFLVEDQITEEGIDNEITD